MGQPHFVPTLVVGVHIFPKVILTTSKLKYYERTKKMKPPLFQGGKSEELNDLEFFH